MNTKQNRNIIEVQGAPVAVLSRDHQDFICLTDIAKFKNPEHSDDVIRNWLRSRSTVEFLGVWERLNNPDFKPVEFDGIRIQTGLNSFVLTPKSGSKKPEPSGLHPARGVTAAHMPTRISLSSSPPGYRLNSNSISSRSFSVSKTMKTTA
jgi:hypothetical protein